MMNQLLLGSIIGVGSVLGQTTVTEKNIALGKAASQSSINWNGAASRAVDGNTEGNYWKHSVTHTSLGYGNWWEVDLGAESNIGTVKVYGRSDCCMRRNKGLEVYLNSQPGEKGGQLIGKEDDPSGTQQLKAEYKVPYGTRARYVHVVLKAKSYLSLAEVEVYEPVEKNIALGKAASQSSIGWSGAASRAVDGNTEGNYWKHSVTHTAYGYGNWWEVDLGAESNIGTVKVYGRSDCCLRRNKGLEVYLNSQPGAKGGQLIGKEDDPSGTQQLKAEYKVASGTRARYVHVVLKAKSYLSLAEVEVYGAEAGSSVAIEGTELGSVSVEGKETVQGWTSDACCSDFYSKGKGVNGTVTLTNLPQYAKSAGVRLSFLNQQVGKHVVGTIGGGILGQKLLGGGLGVQLRCREDYSVAGGCSFFLVLHKQCNSCGDGEKTNGNFPKLLSDASLGWEVAGCAPKFNVHGEEGYEMVTYHKKVGVNENVSLPLTSGALQHFAVFHGPAVAEAGTRGWCPKASGSQPVATSSSTNTTANSTKALPAAPAVGCIQSLQEKNTIVCMKPGQRCGYSLPKWIRGHSVVVRAHPSTVVILCDWDNLSYNRLAAFYGTVGTAGLKQVKAKNGQVLDFDKPRSMRVGTNQGLAVSLGCITNRNTGAIYCLRVGQRSGYSLPKWVWYKEVELSIHGAARVYLCDWDNLSYNRIGVFKGTGEGVVKVFSREDLIGVKAKNGKILNFNRPRSMAVRAL